MKKKMANIFARRKHLEVIMVYRLFFLHRCSMSLDFGVGCDAYQTSMIEATVLDDFEIENDLNYDANYFVDNYEGCCFD